MATSTKSNVDLEEELILAVQEINEKEKTCKQLLSVSMFFGEQCYEMSQQFQDQIDQISELERNNLNLQQYSDYINNENEERIKKIQVLECEQNDLNRIIRQLQDTLGNKQQDINVLQKENKELKKYEKQLNNEINTFEKFIEKNKAFKVLTEENLLINKENSLNQQIKENSNNIQELEFLLKDKEKEICLLSIKFKALERQLEKEKEQVNFYQTEKFTQEVELDKVQQELKNARQTIVELQTLQKQHQQMIDKQIILNRFQIQQSPMTSTQNSPLQKQLKNLQTQSFNMEQLQEIASPNRDQNFSLDTPTELLFLKQCSVEQNFDSMSKKNSVTIFDDQDPSSQPRSNLMSPDRQSTRNTQPNDIMNFSEEVHKKEQGYFDKMMNDLSTPLRQQDECKLTLIKSHKKPYDYHDRRETAETEFFKMTVLAIKVNYPHIDKVCLLDSNVLHEKAQQQEVPFYKFYEWIKDEMDRSCLEIIYSFKKTSSIALLKDLSEQFDQISPKANNENAQKRKRKSSIVRMLKSGSKEKDQKCIIF